MSDAQHAPSARGPVPSAAQFTVAPFPVAQFPVARPRRLRRTAALRRLVAETRLHPADLVLPMFVKESLTEPAPLSSMLLSFAAPSMASMSARALA